MTEPADGVYWLLALYAIGEDKGALAADVYQFLEIGCHTNFLFHCDGLVGLVVADTTLTRAIVDVFMPSYKQRIVFGHDDSSVERFGFTQFVAFVANNEDKNNKDHIPLRWWGRGSKDVMMGPEISGLFA